MSVKVLALDLERTLIDNALSVRPRPGLADFLTFCYERFDRVVIFTTVEESDARAALAELDTGRHLPAGMLDRTEFIDWCGEYKDLAFVRGASPDQVLLIDDDGGWVRPDQRERWIPIKGWEGGLDVELIRVRAVLERWLGNCALNAEAL